MIHSSSHREGTPEWDEGISTGKVIAKKGYTIVMKTPLNTSSFHSISDS